MQASCPRQACLMNRTICAAHPTLQGYLQDRHEGMQHQPSTARGSDIILRQLAIKGQGRRHVCRGKERHPAGGKKNPQAAEASDWSNRTYPHSCCLHLQQKVSAQLPMSLIGMYSHSRCCSSTDQVQNTIIFRDRRLPSHIFIYFYLKGMFVKFI